VTGAAVAISIATVVVAFLWFVVAGRMLASVGPAVRGELSRTRND
jgi:hypothetical protein